MTDRAMHVKKLLGVVWRCNQKSTMDHLFEILMAHMALQRASRSAVLINLNCHD
jgi:hypothetical protein